MVNKSPDELKNNLFSLANDYEIISKIIEDYRRNTSVIKQQIVIELPICENKLTTLRVNEQVLEEFNKFAEEHKQYKKVDLLSQALKNFIDQHK